MVPVDAAGGVVVVGLLYGLIGRLTGLTGLTGLAELLGFKLSN